MTEIPFDLPRATALLDQLIKQTVSATTHARLCADGVRRDPRAFTDGAADDYDAEADELVEEADLLHAISRRLVAGERDRERLDAIERSDIELQCMGTTVPYFNAWSRTSNVFTTADGKRDLRQILDCARSSEGSPNT